MTHGKTVQAEVNKEKLLNCAGILEQSMGARSRVGIGLSYQPARLHRLAESIPLESVPGLLKRLQIRPLATHNKGSKLF